MRILRVVDKLIKTVYGIVRLARMVSRRVYVFGFFKGYHVRCTKVDR